MGAGRLDVVGYGGAARVRWHTLDLVPLDRRVRHLLQRGRSFYARRRTTAVATRAAQGRYQNRTM